jgi:putative hydrolase of the HAD superfamily
MSRSTAADGAPGKVRDVTPLPSLPDPETVDAVIFDAGGVLLLPDAAAGQAAIRTLDCESSREDWHRAHYTANLAIDQMETPDWESARQTIASAVGVPDHKLDAAVALLEELMVTTPWVAVDGAADALRALSGAGYQLGVVSNASGTVAELLADNRVCSASANSGGDSDLPQVSIIVDSYLVGIEKPDPRIFHIALDALGVTAGRSLYVGDTVRFDVIGARAAGLHPVHVDPFRLCSDDGHSHIATLGELAEWLIPG